MKEVGIGQPTSLLDNVSLGRTRPTLHENFLLLDDFVEHIYHVESSHDSHAIIQFGLIPSYKDVEKRRRAVFFTVMDPMYIDYYRENYVVSQSRIEVYNTIGNTKCSKLVYSEDCSE